MKRVTRVLGLCLLTISLIYANKKTTIAVLTLKNTSGITKGEVEVISDRLRNELFKTGVVDVMEREQMQEVLKEQGFQHSGACNDEGCMVEIGHLLGVKKIVTGSIGSLGNMFLVNIRAVSVQTGKITQVVSQDVNGGIEAVVHVLPEIARQLVGLSKPAPTKQQSQSKSASQKPADLKVIKGAKVYLELLPLTKKQVLYEPTNAEITEANEYVLAGFNEILKSEAVLCPRAKLNETAGDNALVIRMTIESYTEQDARLRQKEVIIKLRIDFYEGPSGTNPIFTARFQEIGERHWEADNRMVYAFEAIGEAIEDKLGRHDFIKKLNKKLR